MRRKLSVVSNTCQIKWSYPGSSTNDSSDVRPVSLTIHGIVVRFERRSNIFLVPNEIEAFDDLVAFTKAFAKCRVVVVDACVDAILVSKRSAW